MTDQRKKRKASLSLEDLRMLGRVLEFDTLTKAAKNLGVPRVHLSRLMERAAREVGAELNWRVSGRKKLTPPAEIHRLVSPNRIRALELASGFPWVAAGSMMQIWFQSRLVSFDCGGDVGPGLPPRMQVVRSADAITALRSYEVDLALVHECPGDKWADRIHSERFELAASPDAALTCRTLAPWTAIAIGPAGAPAGPTQGWRAVWWSPSGTAGRISVLARRSKRISYFLGGGKCDLSHNQHFREPGSWLSAFEEARQGLPVRFVIPSVFVPESDRGRLTVVAPEATEVACKGSIVAIYRASDERRFTSIWAALHGCQDASVQTEEG